jgi:16S rRNA (cytosine1402-N4)-methyltransferase
MVHYHRPAFIPEVVDLLRPKPHKIIIDATLGNGGHSLVLLKLQATVHALDLDSNNISLALNRLKQLNLSANFHPHHLNFANLSDLFPPHFAHGLLLDLGLSWNQIKTSGLGFSFSDRRQLDMRLDPSTQSVAAFDIINHFTYHQLFTIFSTLAQEKYSSSLAKLIVKSRPISSSFQLANLIAKFYPHYSRLHPATKIFLALRIAVNQEFLNLKKALDASLIVLKTNSPVVIISYHSGEDRIVKRFIAQHHLVHCRAILSTSNYPPHRSAILRSYQTHHEPISA